MRCTCGIPNKANYHVQVVLSRDVPGGTETTYTDVYVCTEHYGQASLIGPDGNVDPFGIERSLLRWDGHEQWQILSSKITELR